MATAEEYMEVFKKGTLVEVSSEDEGLRSCWYTAIVLRTISKKSNICCLNTTISWPTTTPPSLSTSSLAPFSSSPIHPPDFPSRRYRLMEDVDAFHNDGWWEGVVSKVMIPEVLEGTPSSSAALVSRSSSPPLTSGFIVSGSAVTPGSFPSISLFLLDVLWLTCPLLQELRVFHGCNAVLNLFFGTSEVLYTQVEVEVTEYGMVPLTNLN